MRLVTNFFQNYIRFFICNIIRVYQTFMRAVKSRNWSNKEDDDLGQLVLDNQKNMKKLSWKEIADQLNAKNPSTKKNGKQCRQRWMNHVNPEVKKSQQWTKQENDILFSYHLEIGNKWAEISTRLPGRTDNCIKNHFYSVMRGGLRKLNSYIRNVKRKLVIVKTFKNQILNKILSICERKHLEKFLASDKAYEFALKSKKKLIQISLEQSDDDEFNNEIKQLLFRQVSQFARNCRRKKTKKNQEQSMSESEILQEKQNSSIIQQQQENKTKKQKKVKKDYPINIEQAHNKKKQIQKPNDEKKKQQKNILTHRLQSPIQVQPKIQNQQEQVENNQKKSTTNQNIISSHLLSSTSHNFLQKSGGGIGLFNFVTNTQPLQWNKKSSWFQSSRNGFLFNNVPELKSNKSNDAQKGQLDFNNLSSKDAQQLETMTKNPINSSGYDYFTFNPIFESSISNEPIPFNISFSFSQFSQFSPQAQELFRKSFKESQIIQNEQQLKNQQKQGKCAQKND